MSPRGQRSDQNGLQMVIELIGRYHSAGTSLANLTTAGGIQSNEVYVTPLRTC